MSSGDVVRAIDEAMVSVVGEHEVDVLSFSDLVQVGGNCAVYESELLSGGQFVVVVSGDETLTVGDGSVENFGNSVTVGVYTWSAWVETGDEPVVLVQRDFGDNDRLAVISSAVRDAVLAIA